MAPRRPAFRAPRPTRRSWLRFGYEARFSLDPGGPTWATAVLREVRLPRWSFEHIDHGAVVFVRTVQDLGDGPAQARIWLKPGIETGPAAAAKLPEVKLEVAVHGRWTNDDEVRSPPPAFGQLLEEAEALLVLLGCRSPRFKFRGAVRTAS